MLFIALIDRLIEYVVQLFITEQLMNPLPVSLDLASNSTSKPSAKTSASNDVDANKFKNELNKQENNAQDKDTSRKSVPDSTAKQNDTTKNEEAATVASQDTVSGEELPPQAEGEHQYAVIKDDISLDAESMYMGELGIPTDQVTLIEAPSSIEVIDPTDQVTLIEAPSSIEVIDSIGRGAASVDPQASSMVLEGEESMLRLLGVPAEEGVTQLPYSSPGALGGPLNVAPLNGVGTVSEDALLEQPLEKLMTLEQMKLSLEKGVETLAELEVDVDTDSEGTIREVFRFNDLQLKESQSSLKTYTTSVELPVSQGAWAEKVNDKIVWLANQKIQFAEIHLNPQDLGPMEVKINVQNDQATVTFNSQHQGVRELLELNVNRLREMMSENGVDLAHVDVSDQSSQQQSDDEEGGDVTAQSGEGDDELSSLAEDGSITDAIALNNLVDYYA